MSEHSKIGILESLGIDRHIFDDVETTDPTEFFPTDRPPSRPGQVTEMKEILEGMFYEPVSILERGEEFVGRPFIVVRGPYEIDGEPELGLWIDGWTKGEDNNSRSFFIFQKYSLADYSVTPYKNGYWNDSNYIRYHSSETT